MKTVVYAMVAVGAFAALGCGDKTQDAKPTPAATATGAAKAPAAPAGAAKTAAPGGW